MDLKSVIINREYADMGIPSRLLELLPYRLADAVRRELGICGAGVLCEEIRIRRGRMSSLTLSGGVNLPLDVSLSREEMENTVDRLCGGSLYAHGDTNKKGYISLFGGIRAGVSGRAATENGHIIGVSDISGICIRLPHFVKVDPTPVCDIIRALNFSSGVLVYSPPGIGKTTLLRSVATEMSKGKDAVRVCVIDSRGELEFGLQARNVCADILSGYPKSIGIEIALRTMNAQLIICDEIGSEDEIEAICAAANGGVALLASAHADDISGLMAKKNIKALHDAMAFGAYVGLSRNNDEYRYDISYRKDIC